ncbi:LysM peptidoglycan-binding domain-containing protein [Arthrobacter sp. UYEF36]|uniref:LysM peptidoglycan-binding domain-containing protein n=1 Tax=Arthrobacter sp. UYEF36 TaxID=1756366 RepID=UPI003390C775
MQMVPNEYDFRGNRRTTQVAKSLITAGSLLLACVLAASLAPQPPAGVSTTARQSLAASDTSSPAVQESSSEPPAIPVSAAVPPPAAPFEAGGGVAEPSRAAPPEAPGVDADSNRYLVVAGDTVGAIASRFGVNVYDMLAANGLGAYSLIYPGQTLKLSGPPVPVPVPVPVPALAAPVPAAPALTAAVAPAVRTVFVAGAGGQAMVDRCIGPIHFTPTDAYSLFITEHDFCGGWARFSGVGVGETVVISGYGTYTATGRGQVAQGATTNAVSAVFGGFPRAILQTCIPGTNRMLLIALN